MKQDTANGETDETGMQTLLIGLDRDYVFIQTDDDQEDSREEDGHSQMQQGETVNTTTFA